MSRPQTDWQAVRAAVLALAATLGLISPIAVLVAVPRQVVCVPAVQPVPIPGRISMAAPAGGGDGR